ncbi:carboxymuconolactone decarboxylase family protein [Streptomyces sp. NBC_01754]|uniref:carboxymuconolactone decarboxylase family protein n=1 Tax=Streptomyces sp. NBC_01754 TaxID=2975930 RepID=UPI002DD8680A|nr:carboxymuconolactone decarboxylase family protein [Streptomyces sp. NBC_01754]WSC96208.1 carboxymuconolactone decarboxylase family protein [Streptomyces sp. NBC_01754]
MRLPVLAAEEMNDHQQELHARITARRGGVRGPFRVWLRSPELCERVESLGAFVRFDSSLPKHLRELTLLMAARHFDAQYSWNAHVTAAIEAGIPAEAVEAIAERRVPVFADEADTAFHDFCEELLETHFVSDETFARAHGHFGAQALVDAIGSLGNFTMLGMCLNAFQVDLQPGRRPPFPDIRGFAHVTGDGDRS